MDSLSYNTRKARKIALLYICYWIMDNQVFTDKITREYLRHLLNPLLGLYGISRLETHSLNELKGSNRCVVSVINLINSPKENHRKFILKSGLIDILKLLQNIINTYSTKERLMLYNYILPIEKEAIKTIIGSIYYSRIKV